LRQSKSTALARVKTSAAWKRASDVEHLMFARPLRSFKESEGDREWHARGAEAPNASDREDDIAIDLLHIQPTTVAGRRSLGRALLRRAILRSARDDYPLDRTAIWPRMIGSAKG
jgi:hypothetical protein